MSVKHLEHRGSGALHNGDARQQGRAQVKRQDWACRRGENYLLLSDNVIQLGTRMLLVTMINPSLRATTDLHVVRTARRSRALQFGPDLTAVRGRLVSKWQHIKTRHELF